MKKQVFWFPVFALLQLNLQAQCLVINEVYARPAAAGTNGNPCDTGEWIELFNASSSPVDISCYSICSFENQSGTNRGHCVTIPAGTVIPAGGFYLMGGNGSVCPTCDFTSGALQLNWHSYTCASGMVTGVNQSCGTCGATNRMQFLGVFHDTGEDLSLFDASGAFVDGVTYGSRGARGAGNLVNIAAAGGCPARSLLVPGSSDILYEFMGPAGGAGSGFERSSDGGGLWAPTTTATASPGATNGGTAACTPLSASAILFSAVFMEGWVQLEWNLPLSESAAILLVERSEDGLVFEPVLTQHEPAFVGTFEEELLFNRWYYRLRIHTRNGGVVFSQVVSVTTEVRPGSFTFSGGGRALQVRFEEGGTFQLLAADGRLLSDVYGRVGEWIQVFPEGIPAGIYFLRMDRQAAVRKVVLL